MQLKSNKRKRKAVSVKYSILNLYRKKSAKNFADLINDHIEYKVITCFMYLLLAKGNLRISLVQFQSKILKFVIPCQKLC